MDFFVERNLTEIRRFEGRINFDAHLHSDVEIIYLKRGKGGVHVGSEEYAAEEGDFVVIFPNQIHRYTGSHDNMGKISIAPYAMLHEYNEFLSSNIPVSPIVHDAGRNIKKLYKMLFREYDLFDKEICRGILLAVLGMLFAKMEFVSIKRENNSSIDVILQYCSENYRNDINIDSVARELHISRSYISHIFSEKLKINFRDYINSLRVSCAQNILKKSEDSITEIAGRAGFDSVRTFNRAFLKYTGTTPSEYRKK